MESENTRIEELSRELKMPVFRTRLDELVECATRENWGYRRLVRELLEIEAGARIENRRKQRVRHAGFTELKYLDELDCKELPEDARVALPELETLDFIREGRNVVMVWKSGYRQDTYCYGHSDQGLPGRHVRYVYYRAASAQPNKGMPLTESFGVSGTEV